ncbi:MAG: Por secretion system protein, partial [Bacteroidales bacterium]|nr:Por secretion system protein [Candidatus Colimorpha onthohippi]
DHGTVGYRGTATYAFGTPDPDIHVFPNPVRPDYSGPIAVRGFTRDALVHIVDIAGHVVYTTKAQGGQAIWNGLSSSGHRVSSGTYYVFASDADGQNRSVAKILIVR